MLVHMIMHNNYGLLLCSWDKDVKMCGLLCSFIAVCLSALFDIIGVILRIVPLVQASKESDSPAGPLACGSLAIIFATISAINNIAICGVAGHEKATTDQDQTLF